MKRDASNIEISVVSPVYQAEQIVDELVNRIIEEVKKFTHNFEVVLVDDGSDDSSWQAIEKNCEIHPEVKGIKLSRNFGQHHAVSAGLERASGDAIVIIDCDLQDDPKNIQKLYQEYSNGYEVVFTKRIQRRHSPFKAITARIYNMFFYLLADKNYNVDVGSLTLISKKVKNEFVKMEDKERLYIQLIKWLGFNSTYVHVEHHARYSGQSSYSFFQLLKIAVNGWTFHSDKLLKLSIYVGSFFSISAFVSAIYVVIRYFTHGFQSGWASTTVLILFSTGLILISIGIAGIYLGKVFEQSKNRPLFIIDKEINL